MSDAPPRPLYAREQVLTPDEVRDGLRLSPRQWARTRHVLPWSYAFGTRCPRISWGQVLDFVAQRKSA